MNQTEEKNRCGICDIHSHTLFGIDDGSLSIEMSLDMLRMAIDQGVTHLFCASHSWGKQEDYEEAYAALLARVRQERLPITLHTGSEVVCLEEDLPNVTEGIRTGKLRTMNGGDYVLLEFRSWAPYEEFRRCYEEIREKTGKGVILAHAERCDAIRADVGVAQRLKDLGFLIQVNTCSMVAEKEEITKNAAHALIEHRIPDFLGSDAHRTDYRPHEVESGMTYLRRVCDAEYLEALCIGNARKYLGIE